MEKTERKLKIMNSKYIVTLNEKTIQNLDLLYKTGVITSKSKYLTKILSKSINNNADKLKLKLQKQARNKEI